MELTAVFAPLIGALLAGLFGRALGDRGAQAVTCGLMLIAAAASVFLFAQVNFGDGERVVHLFNWISSGDLTVAWALRLDALSCLMMVVVNLVSCAVHFYSIGYMSHDESKARFMAYLSLFTFMMLMLVTADNFVQLFFGWEGVGLASYLLIGFWNRRDSANAAAIKAFVVNRIGDFGLILGMLAVFFVFGTLNFDQVFTAVPQVIGTNVTFLTYNIPALELICALLFIGAMGKSAQLGLHTWLPDAMEGPTPVSALIHAATMVTAGVFLLCRLSPLYEYAPHVQNFVTVIGGMTALVAATIALTQFDIKRVIAYSTMSQLGYMFFALGVGAYGAAMFHLFTHAFFKALLFLGAGSVIHAMSGEQDMRRMGGIWKHIPITYALMWIGSLALAGIPFFAGYYSKDLILEAAFAAQNNVALFAFACGIVAAMLTAFYSWRLLFLTFHGAPRAEEKVMAHIHESPAVMLVPLYVLAAGALFAGWWTYDWFAGSGRAAFWGAAIYLREGRDIVEAAHHVDLWVKLLPVIVAVAGIVLAWVLYMKFISWPVRLSHAFPRIHGFLFNKWYFDELYHKTFVAPTFKLGKFLWKSGDGATIDRLGPDGVAAVVRTGSERARKMQSGYVFHYAFAILVGVVLFLSLYFIKVSS